MQVSTEELGSIKKVYLSYMDYKNPSNISIEDRNRVEDVIRRYELNYLPSMVARSNRLIDELENIQ